MNVSTEYTEWDQLLDDLCTVRQERDKLRAEVERLEAYVGRLKAELREAERRS